MSEMVPIDYLCKHCGKQLAVVGERQHGMRFEGLRDLVYVHVDGTDECIIKRKPKPFDAWEATRRYEQARKRSYSPEKESADD